MLSEDQELLESLYEELNRASAKNVEYLKLLKTYSKRILESDDIIDAKKWAERMVDHAVLIIENEDL